MRPVGSDTLPEWGRQRYELPQRHSSVKPSSTAQSLVLNSLPSRGRFRSPQSVQDSHVQDGILQTIVQRRGTPDRLAESLPLKAILIHRREVDASGGAIAMLAAVIDED